MTFSTLLLALATGLGTSGSADPASAALDRALAPQLALYGYGEDLELRDFLIRKGRMYDDIGGWIVGDADPSLGVGYARLPELYSGEVLVTVIDHEHHESRRALEEAGRAVWSVPGGRATFKAYPVEALSSLSLNGFACHGSFRAVQTQQPIVPSSFPYDGTDGPGRIPAITPKPAIQNMVSQVVQQNIEDTVDDLVAFGTRRHGQPGEVSAENYLVGEFQSLGLSVSTFDYDSGADVVIAEQPGATDPDRIVVIGGHYDSVNWQGSDTDPAPGADDDASGVAAVIEIARILSQHQFDYTIRYCPWSGEEFGLLGSEAYAAALDAADADIVGMVQLDMIAYRANGDTLSVDFVLNDTTPSLNQFSQDAYAAYVPTLDINESTLGGGTSDHRSFFNHGFPATFPFEDLGNYSPFIHTPDDTVGTSANDFVLARLITQGALATVAELARPVSMSLDHVALGDTADEAGPYDALITVVPNNGETITGVDLFWREGGGAWNQVAMNPTANPDEWSAGIPGQSGPAFVDYYLVATDTGSNQGWLPTAFSPGDDYYSFIVGVQNSVVFYDFEAGGDEGWTHGGTGQDDWMHDQPNGAAGDPSSAFSGTRVWGNDLAPSGWNGYYSNDVSNWLESPAFNMTGQSNVFLSLQRHLSVEEEQFDQAIIRVNGNEVWRNPAGVNLVDSGWTQQTIDISSIADDNPSVTLRFELITDGGVVFGGWNIDDVELVSITGGGGPIVDSINLSGDTVTIPGNVVSYAWDSAPSSAPYGIYYSKRLDGYDYSGHPLDIGPNIKLLDSGTTSPSGTGSYSSPPVPNRFSGRTAYIEVVVDDGGQISDSNFVQLDIL